MQMMFISTISMAKVVVKHTNNDTIEVVKHTNKGKLGS